ncbi:hypothetical protein ACLKA7_005833 [Drosophila subpalustris]
MSLLRAKNGVGGGGGGVDGRGNEMPTMRPVSMGGPLVTMSTYQERGETLKRTSFMPDDSCYRNNNNNNSSNKIGNNNIGNNNGSNRISLLNGASNSNNSNGSTELPPPPPQFANPQKQQQQQQQQQLKLNLSNGVGSRKAATPTSPPLRSPSINVGGMQRAPATPQPDYDAGNGQTTTTTTNGSQQQQQQRRTLRLGTVTIGEYGEQRTKRETLRKTPSIGREGHSNGILKNGSRSSANLSSNNNNNNSYNNNNNRQQQQQQTQHTEKSIKFGN